MSLEVLYGFVSFMCLLVFYTFWVSIQILNNLKDAGSISFCKLFLIAATSYLIIKLRRYAKKNSNLLTIFSISIMRYL